MLLLFLQAFGAQEALGVQVQIHGEGESGCLVEVMCRRRSKNRVETRVCFGEERQRGSMSAAERLEPGAEDGICTAAEGGVAGRHGGVRQQP